MDEDERQFSSIIVQHDHNNQILELFPATERENEVTGSLEDHNVDTCYGIRNNNMILI